MHSIQTSNGLKLEVDPRTGQWISLVGGDTTRSWLSPVPGDRPGLPFLGGGSTDPGILVPLTIGAAGHGEADHILSAASRRGGCRVRMVVDDDAIVADYVIPDLRGPRAGVHLPLDHLDRVFITGSSADRSVQITPVIMENAPDFEWSYIVWQRSETDLLVLCVDGTHAGWRIIYSYAGHRMIGFRLLARADDVLADPSRFVGGHLPSTSSLRFKLALASSRAEALEVAGRLLDLEAVVPVTNGAFSGSSIHVVPAGVGKGSVETVLLDHPGIVDIEPSSGAGRTRRVISRVCSLDGWVALAARAVLFHTKHFQTETGAFARAVSGETLLSDRRTTAGVHFGDPDEAGSCMTGEFGGFGAWAALLHGPVLHDVRVDRVVDRYFDWLLNRGREDRPLPGTIWPQGTPLPAEHDAAAPGTHTTDGSDPAPNHLWGVPHFAQYESWAIAQLADGVVRGDDSLRAPLAGVVEHYLDEHVGENGAVYNRRYADEPQDYCTVDAPLVHLISAARVLHDSHAVLAARAREVARGIADHIARRGYDFPTEGEQCTEDGSIACAAWSLAFAYNELLDPDPGWLEFAQELLVFHRKLELSGTDVRTRGSTLRFWETMYESDDWGPSINAGHAWTLWTAFAEWELFRATRGFAFLESAWERSLCVASRVGPDGRMPVCFTPDPVPQVGHTDAAAGRAAGPSGDGDEPESGELDAIRREGEMTSVRSANCLTSSLSASGMFLFIFAAKVWYSVCGYDPLSGSAVNARVNGNQIEPCTPFGCRVIALSAVPLEPLRVTGFDPGDSLRIVVDGADEASEPLTVALAVSGGLVSSTRNGEYQVKVERDWIEIRKDTRSGRSI